MARLLETHRRLALRLAGAVAVGVLVVAALAGAVAVREAGHAAEQRLDARAAGIATEAEATLDARRHTGKLKALSERENARVRVRRARETDALSESGGTRVYRFPVAGRPRQMIEVTISAGAIGDARRDALLEVALAALLALLAGVGLAWLVIQRGVVRPLRMVTTTLDRLRSGAHDERAPVSGVREVAALARSVNALGSTFTELSTQASTDPLTGVANRRTFHAALAAEFKRADRHEEPMALVVIDLDGFKEVNDQHGHPFGDRILRQMAKQLRETMRATDVLARVGGDEFAMILPGMDRQRAQLVVERAREATIQLVEGTHLSWCAGIACFPNDARTGDTLLECADAALYCAKNGGEGPICHYDPERDAGPPAEGARAAVEALLAHPDAVVPVFQPLVSLSTGRIAGYEALARFPNPPARRPDEWFELAHRAGLGPELEARAVATALACPGRPEGTYVSFNLSPSAISSEQVAKVLPADLSGFVVEITEHEQVADEAALHRQLDVFRSRGARIAIDDAGAGYSGLQQVMRVQPDLIKLDRSLVANVDQDPAKAALIDSFVRFGRRTGASVCAEGIETAEELKLLADLDVSFGQGYGLARPAAPWAEVASWVEGTLRVRRIDGNGGPGGASEAQQNADMRLADVVGRLAGVARREELGEITELISGEVGADEVAVLECVEDEPAIEALTPSTALATGERLAISNYQAVEGVLARRESLEVLSRDASVGIGEIALLERGGYGSMLLMPAVYGNRALGLLVCFSRTERHWSRSETSRARIAAHQLAATLSAMGAAAASRRPASAPAPAVLRNVYGER